ncbi:hypothetical protein ZWY2020_034831 [Hordeum vulgare]|nr:hypothetical protein ZWY2020_034831 [Hordeum vulgare]
MLKERMRCSTADKALCVIPARRGKGDRGCARDDRAKMAPTTRLRATKHTPSEPSHAGSGQHHYPAAAIGARFLLLGLVLPTKLASLVHGPAHFIEQLQREGTLPNARTYTVVVSHLAGAGFVDQALEVFRLRHLHSGSASPDKTPTTARAKAASERPDGVLRRDQSRSTTIGTWRQAAQTVVEGTRCGRRTRPWKKMTTGTSAHAAAATEVGGGDVGMGQRPSPWKQRR